jgi:hypothetical protein
MEIDTRVLDGYAGVWFSTTNQESFSKPPFKTQTKSPIGSFEGHLSYDAKGYRGKPTLWFSLDGNFWFGGTTSARGISNPETRQTSSRIGATAALPLTQHQAIKISYSTGAVVRFGGDYKNLSVVRAPGPRSPRRQFLLAVHREKTDIVYAGSQMSGSRVPTAARHHIAALFEFDQKGGAWARQQEA